MPDDVRSSYSRRAAEYIEHFGSMASVHPSDVQLVTSWAEAVDGPVIDAGCGPGQWTAHLARRGVDARGIDQVAAFVEHAEGEYPGVPFAVGSLDALPVAAGTVGGILAWYSLIHLPVGALRAALAEFARVLRPGGGLLVGFFVGPSRERFDHAVVTAYRWPAEELAAELRGAGFTVIETHTRSGAAPLPRPHGAILARRASSGDDGGVMRVPSGQSGVARCGSATGFDSAEPR